MNSVKFYILTGLSSLVVLLLLTQGILGHIVDSQQQQILSARETINEGQQSETRLQQVAYALNGVAAQTNDQALKDILTRQNIVVRVPAADTNASSSTAPAAAH